MEQPPHNPEDRGSNIPHLDDLEPGEIDLTGAIQQDTDLHDVIEDTLFDAHASGGGVSEWGARTLARALANRREHPITGALHHFAAIGRLDKEAVLNELVELRTYDPEITAWIIRLRLHIERRQDETAEPVTTAPAAAPAEGSHETTPEALIGSVIGEEFDAYLQFAFTEADTHRVVISRDDAQAIASLLSRLLPPESQMGRFAETNDADPALLTDECRSLESRTRQTPISAWLERLEQHLAASTDLGRQAGTDT